MRLTRNPFLLSGLVTLALLLSSCASGKAGVKPFAAERPSEEAFRTELKKELSSLNVAIEASSANLGDYLNRMAPKELYKGSTKTKGLTADILRNGPLVVSAADEFIYITIPISLALSYSIFETPAITTRLKFKINARVTPDWQVKADIYYTGLSDLLAEDVGIGPISIKPRSIVEGLIQPVQRTLSDLISRKLNEKFPLKTQVAKVWNAAQKPILLDKNYNAWLTISPREVLLYPLYARNNQVKLSVGLKSYAELVVGPEPPARSPLPIPNLQLVDGTEKSFRVALHTDLYYRDILKIASPLLLNKELGSNGKSVILKDLDLYGNGDRLIIKAQTAGDLEGIIYLTCRPVFNPQTNIFSVEDVDFDMQTQNLLLQSADWFLHGTIRSTIQEKLNMDLTQRLAEVRDLAAKAMARVQLAENTTLTGTVKTIRLNDVMVQKDRISIQVYTEGETVIVFR